MSTMCLTHFLFYVITYHKSICLFVWINPFLSPLCVCMWIIRWSAGTDAWVPSAAGLFGMMMMMMMAGVCGISGTFPLQPMTSERGAFHVRKLRLPRAAQFHGCHKLHSSSAALNVKHLHLENRSDGNIPLSAHLFSIWAALGADWTDSRRDQNKWAQQHAQKVIDAKKYDNIWFRYTALHDQDI